MSRRVLALVVALWTLVSWGGRIGLLTDAETGDAWNWIRIAGSLAVGLGTAGVFTFRPSAARWVAWPFGAFTTLLWTRSLWTVWTEPNPPAFRLVHTGLAVAWFGLAVAVGRAAYYTNSPPVSETDRAAPGGRIAANRETTSSTDR
jgi:hypothetical protein